MVLTVPKVPSGHLVAQARVRELLAEYQTSVGEPADVFCDRHPASAPAVTFVRRDLRIETADFAELTHRSRHLAATLVDAGVRPGDRVATLMGKSLELVVAMLAVWRAGAVHVPLFTAFARDAVNSRLREAGAAAIIFDAEQAGKIDGPGVGAIDRLLQIRCTPGADGSGGGFAVGASAGGPAVEDGFRSRSKGDLFEIFTSGTTGKPKGVVVPLEAMAAFVSYAEFGLDLRPEDVFWNAADPGWAYGLWYGVAAPLALGRAVILVEGGFDPTLTWRVLSRLGVTNFSAAPTIYRALRASERPHGLELNLRCAASAGEPLTPEVNAWATDALGLRVRDHYGQTELGMVINNHAHPLLMQPIREGSMGHPMPGWAIEILRPDADEAASAGTLGRVAVNVERSPLNWFAGYRQDQNATAERYAGGGRWFLTGDTATQDEDGYIHFSARADDVIIMAGYRIGPLDIESILVTHPAIVECAIIAAPDDLRGEVVEAYVVLRPHIEATQALVEELQQLVKDRYGAHAYPRKVHFRPSLPKTPSGKVQRNVLRDERREQLSAALAPT